MSYLINGESIWNLCDQSYEGDTRTKAPINTEPYLTGGQTRAQSHPNAGQLLTYSSGFTYMTNGLAGGKYLKNNGLALTAAALGCRPSRKHRCTWFSPGTYFLKQNESGEWIYSNEYNFLTTSTKILPSGIKYCFVKMNGGGGGGGSAALTASAGGGGGGGFMWFLVKLAPYNVIKVGASGVGGTSGGNGTAGTSSSWTCYQSSTQYQAGTFLDTVSVFGGQGGYGGGNNSGGGGGGGGYDSPSSGDYIKEVNQGAGAGGAGGKRNAAGISAPVAFYNYTPESERLEFAGTGGLSGGTTGGGGGGGSASGRGGDGGNDGSGGLGSGGSGGGGGGYVAFERRPGGNGGSGDVEIFY